MRSEGSQRIEVAGTGILGSKAGLGESQSWSFFWEVESGAHRRKAKRVVRVVIPMGT